MFIDILIEVNKNLVEYYKALANPVRLAVFLYIANESKGAAPSTPNEESCVTAISRALSLPQPTVSNHLKVLKNAGLVKSVNKDTHCYQYITKKATETLFEHTKYLFKQAHSNPY
jgi:DNA-binding transcriptional ArsR family regulator